jgi:hypothetical protein
MENTPQLVTESVSAVDKIRQKYAERMRSKGSAVGHAIPHSSDEEQHYLDILKERGARIYTDMEQWH